MGNIKLADIPQAPTGARLGAASLDTGTAEAKAMQGLGGAMQQAGGLMVDFHQKRQKERFNAANAEMELKSVEVQEEINDHFANNPNDPIGSAAFAKERASKLMDGVDLSGMSEDQLMEVGRSQQLISAKLVAGANNMAIRRRISIDNSKVQAAANFDIQNGNIESAVKKIDDSFLGHEEKVDFLTKGIQGSTSNEVGMTVDAIEDPDELESYAASLLEKDGDIYKTHREEISLPSSPDEVIKIAGLEENQRKYYARLARQRADGIRRKQRRNWSAISKSASRGDPQAITQLSQSITEEGELGIPKEQREKAEETITKAIDAYEEGENFKVLEKAAQKDEDYKEITEEFTAYLFDPEGFDLDSALDDIDGLDVSEPVKADLISRAFGLASDLHDTDPEMHRDQSFEFSELLPFVAFYKDIWGKEDVTKQENGTLSRVYKSFKGAVDSMGNYDGLTKDLKNAQAEIGKFYEENESPNQAEIAEMEKRVLFPIQEKAAYFLKYGKSK